MDGRCDAADEQRSAAAPSAAPTPLCSRESTTLLCVLPYCNIAGWLWVYTALPLHFVDRDWPLWQLALLLSLCYVPRATAVAMYARAGDWTCVPMKALALAGSVLMVIWPRSLTVVWIGICLLASSVCPTAYRSLVFARFVDDGEWQLQRAMRIFTLSDTVGYASAPFVGGVLYDFGGLRACAVFAAATSAIALVLPVGLGVVRQSFTCWWHGARRSPPSSGSAAADVVASAVTTGDEEMREKPNGSAVSVKPMGSAASVRAFICADDTAPIAATMIMVYANLCIYAVEWCLYALYFRAVYNWSGAWMGFAQMAGDLLAGVALGISTMSQVVAAAKRIPLPRLLHGLMRPPFGVSVLCCCHGALMCMLAQPHFLVALLGQVLLGTTYVFCEQCLQEMLLVYSFGSYATHRRLQSIHYIFFTAGAALCAPIAFGLYEQTGSFSSAFYATGGFAGTVGVGFAAFFACRLAPTTAGCLGGLRDAEEELRARRLKGRASGTRQAGDTFFT